MTDLYKVTCMFCFSEADEYNSDDLKNGWISLQVFYCKKNCDKQNDEFLDVCPSCIRKRTIKELYDKLG